MTDTTGASSMHMNEKKASCCAPSAKRSEAEVNIVEPQAFAALRSDQAGSMVALDEGAFLMGTDYAEVFHEDGEGPIRLVTFSPFRIGRSPDTKEQFSSFKEATGYQTETERFGWSFVFWAAYRPRIHLADVDHHAGADQPLRH